MSDLEETAADGDARRRTSAAREAGAPAVGERRWRAFLELGLLLTRARIDVSHVLEAVLDIALEETGCERGLLLVRREAQAADPERSRDVESDVSVEVEIARAAGGVSLSVDEIGYSRTVVRRALDERRPIRLADIAAAPSESGRSTDSASLLGIRTAMCAPLVVLPAGTGRQAPLSVATPIGPVVDAPSARGPGGQGHTERRRLSHHDAPELLGALYVDAAMSVRSFTQDDLAFFQALAHQATAVILAARLYEQATTDPLSRLLARGQLFPRLSRLARRASRSRAGWSTLLVDCDHFKRVNDEHGHAAGDQVIRELGAAILESLRANDLAFRYGGEEFLLALPGTDLTGALVVAERLRASVASRPFAGGRIRVSVSIGAAASWGAAGSDSWEEMARRADLALLEAKRTGRNCVVPWTESLAERTPHDFRREARAPVERDPVLASDLLQLLATTGEAEGAAELSALVLDRTIRATSAERGVFLLERDGALAAGPALNSIGRPIQWPDLDAARAAAVGALAEGRPLIFPAAGGVSALAIPVTTPACVVGAIVVLGRGVSAALIEPNLSLYAALGRQVAIALVHARLAGSAPERTDTSLGGIPS